MENYKCDISIIIISYNTKEILEQCLKSVLESIKEIKAEIFVVDNASTDGSPEMVLKKFPGIKLLKNSTNLGFAKANNQALQQANGKYILFLNSDTIINSHAINYIKQYMDDNIKVGACGCKLINIDNNIQISYGKFPNLKSIVSSYIPGYNRIFAQKQFFYSDPKEVDFIAGAFFIVRREILIKLGGFDENFFFYFEDIDLCKRIKNSGWSIMYNPKAYIIHYGAKSTIINENKYTLNIMLKDSEKYYYSKYYGIFGLFFLSFYAIIGSTINVLLSPFLLIIPNNFEKFKEKVNYHIKNIIYYLK